MSKLRFGIIGIGNMGTGHVNDLLEGKVTEGELCAIADVNPDRLAWAKEKCPGVALYESADEMINSGTLDAIVVAVPHYQHPEYVIKGLRAGLHVMSEKPAGVFTKDVRAMNAEAEKSDKLFGIMFQNRTNPVYEKMHEMVAEGVLGSIKRTSWIITDWYRSQSYYDSGTWRATWRGEGGGVLLNQCPHNLDLWQWILGEMPSKVRAFCHDGKWHDIEVEDDVTAYVEYPNGATGTFVTTTADTPGTNRFEIIGDLGKLVAEGSKLLHYKNKMGEREFNDTYKGGFGEPGYDVVEVPLVERAVKHATVMNNFCAAILGKEELAIPGTEGIKGLTLSNAMHLSSWLDKTVELPLDEDLFIAELNKRVATSKYKEGAGAVLDMDASFLK